MFLFNDGLARIRSGKRSNKGRCRLFFVASYWAYFISSISLSSVGQDSGQRLQFLHLEHIVLVEEEEEEEDRDHDECEGQNRTQTECRTLVAISCRTNDRNKKSSREMKWKKKYRCDWPCLRRWCPLSCWGAGHRSKCIRPGLRWSAPSCNRPSGPGSPFPTTCHRRSLRSIDTFVRKSRICRPVIAQMTY